MTRLVASMDVDRDGRVLARDVAVEDHAIAGRLRDCGTLGDMLPLPRGFLSYRDWLLGAGAAPQGHPHPRHPEIDLVVVPRGSGFWSRRGFRVEFRSRDEGSAPLSDRALAQACESQIVASFDPDGRIRTVNARFLDVFALAEHEIVGEPVDRLHPPSRTHSIAHAALWDALAGGQPWAGILDYQDRDGRALAIHGSYTPIVGADGDVCEIVFLGRPPPSAQDDHRRFEGLFDALNDSHALAEFAADGTITSVNAVYAGALGYDPEEMIGLREADLVDTDGVDCEDFHAVWQRLSDGEAWSGDIARIDRTSAPVGFRASYTPFRGDDGAVTKVLMVGSECTAQMLAARDRSRRIEALDRSNGVIEFAPDGTIRAANANFIRTMGYRKAEEIVGRHHSIFVDDDHAASPDYRAFWDRLRAGEYQSGEFRRRARDGSRVWINATYNAILDRKGNVQSIVKFATDVTAEKRRVAKHDAQIDGIERSQAVIEFDLTGRIREANDRFLKIFGYTRQEVVGQPHSMFVDGVHGVSQEYHDFWKALGKGEARSGEFRRLTKDGRQIWLRAFYNPILDADGSPVGVYKLATEITEEVKARQRMRLLSLVTDKTSNSVVITDAKGRIEYVNEGFSQMTGYVLDEVAGRKPGDVLQGSGTDPATVRRVRDCLRKGEAFYEEILNYSRTGKPYWISLAVSPVFSESGQIERFVSIQSDIDATKRANLEFTRRLETISATSAVAEWSADGATGSRNLFLENMGADDISLDCILAAGERACIRSGETVRQDISWPRAGESPLVLDAVFNGVEGDDGKIAKVLMFGVDITDRDEVVRSALSAIQSSSTRIEEIVGSIQDIGNQTRTLSLNASVEASRAGESGKGFAVVAEEVRNLAWKATEAASQITVLLKDNRDRAASLSDRISGDMTFEAATDPPEPDATEAQEEPLRPTG